MCILYKRNFLRLLDFKPIEIHYLISLSAKLKNAKKNNNEVQYLKGKNIVLLFEKDSTRTRCSFEVAAYDQGANITHLSSQGSQLNYKESMKDTARVLGRIYNGIQFRGYNQKTLKILAKYSDIPVWNGLTNEFHPTQLLADLLTIKEHLPNKTFNQIKLIYIGDGRNNISNSILEATALFGFDLYIISPKIFWPNIQLVNHCLKLAKSNGGNIIITDKIDKDIKGADFIYTDVWVSMGEPQHIWKKRIPYLKKYQVNNNLLEFIENSQIKFLHCLPSFHDNQSVLGKKISKEYKFKNGIEVSNDIFESKNSVVFDQSENRMHTIKAIIVSSLYQNIESLL